MPAVERYVPAAGRAWLTRLYDPAMALTMREGAFRPALVAAVLAAPAPRVVLDVGCGTGTLAEQLALADPAVAIVGVDGDGEVLGRARAKGQRFGDRVRFGEGLASALPLEDGSVDAVVASLVLHHLAPAAKRAALAEARRVLRGGGRLVIADWGEPPDPLMRAAFLALQLLDGFENTREHAAGRVPALIAAAGFTVVTTRQRWRTMWGELELIVAQR